ncbi:hypothetical protein B0T21DRAFT_409748 [Apiosordaria backusii]|uniref:C2H2-type domain-containing protein n=1 Tax=Apiosordaria backusii TaxID=314023 RepID=A0AA40EFA5_9PEZI|nr:hypothetical protein B0T21DRAFT_409748 [Apiosordaria backusii]
MKSTPQDHPPSYEASPKSSQHPASCNYTPSTAQEDRGAGMNHDLERVHSWPSASLARTSKDTVPRQLPDTPFSVSIDSDESTPEEAQRIYLKVLSSGLSALTLNPEPSLSSNSRAIVDEGLLYPLIETDSSTTCAGHNAPPFKPHQFGNSNRPAGISTAENDSQPPSSKTDAANRTGATTRTRRKPNASDDQQEEEEDDTSDGDDRAPPNARKAMSSSKRPMACPYRKRDAKRFSFHTHPKCTEGFANITAVKQHVKKKHMLSDSELASQDHQNFENGITPDFERILAARKPTRVNTWEKLWIVLFNEETDIPSPDHEPCHILESSEAAELMKQLDATDDAINHVMSTYLTSRDPEANMTESRKRKRHGKQKAELINTSGQTNVSKGPSANPIAHSANLRQGLLLPTPLATSVLPHQGKRQDL